MHTFGIHRGRVGAAAAGLLVAPLLAVLVLLAPGIAAADPAPPPDAGIRPVADAPAVNLAATPGPTLGERDLAELSDALQAARRAPFQPGSTSVSLASLVTLEQQYHDPCGDSQAGDLTRLTALDDGPSVGWLWETCIDAPFAGTEHEMVLFLIDATPWTATPTADLALTQFMDGYVLVLDTLGSDDADDWVVVAEGFGEVGQDTRGRTGAGAFILDAFDVDFPTQYRFEVASFVGDDVVDLLPKPGHPTPSFPTSCTLVFADRAQVLVAPDDARQLRRELEADGVHVSSAAPRLGLLVLEDVRPDRLAALEDDPRVRAVEPVTARTAPRVGVRADAGPLRADALVDGLGLSGADDVHLAGTPDPRWPIEQLRLPTAWGRVPSFSAEVAVIDSGIDPTRAGFGGRVGPGFDAVSGQSVPPGRSTSMGAHGTAVSALIAAAQDGPVQGANPGALLRPVLVSSHDGCITSDRVALAIEATLDMPGARIVNLSFGGPEELTAAESAAIERAAAADKILVAATGNDGDLLPDTPSWPAAHPDVIGVGASTVQGLVAPFSQQAAVDVLAPGADVVTYGPFGTIITSEGTSLSAPYVSGALSLWLAANPVASAASARAALVAAADPVAVSVGAGAGILDVDRLLADAGLQPSLPGFADVDPNSTHGPAIAAIAAAGVTSGYPDGTYRPRALVRRGQMATFLARAFDLDVDDAPDPGLSDVALDSTHGPAIAAVVATQVADGYEDGTFRPGEDVTRGQMASFLAGAMGLALDGDGDRFGDAVGTTHAVAIEAIADAGVTSGFPDGTFRPGEPVTRAQMASFLAKAMRLG